MKIASKMSINEIIDRKLQERIDKLAKEEVREKLPVIGIHYKPNALTIPLFLTPIKSSDLRDQRMMIEDQISSE